MFDFKEVFLFLSTNCCNKITLELNFTGLDLETKLDKAINIFNIGKNNINFFNEYQ